jgi:hypothetical protein
LSVSYKDFSSEPISVNEQNIYDIGFYYERLGSRNKFPLTLYSQYHQSFVVFNLPDNTTLQGMDSDGDGLNDYDELFVYMTNPKWNDTDGGGKSDYEEVMRAVGPTNPNLYFDDNYEGPLITLITPTDQSINTTTHQIEFICNAYNSTNISNMTIYLYDDEENLLYNTSWTGLNNANVTNSVIYTLPNGHYISVNVVCVT